MVLHEFGHALGAFHEHQSPDVEIPWDREAVYDYYAQQGWSRLQVDRNLFEAYSPAGVRNSRFDAHSIMLYAVDNALTIGDWEVGWNRVALRPGQGVHRHRSTPASPRRRRRSR